MTAARRRDAVRRRARHFLSGDIAGGGRVTPASARLCQLPGFQAAMAANASRNASGDRCGAGELAHPGRGGRALPLDPRVC